MMNHYDPASVVTAINEAAGETSVRVPPELLEVLLMAQAASLRSGGAFDVTVGGLRGWRFRPGEARLPPAGEIAAQRTLVDYRQLAIDAQRGTLLGIAKLYIVRAGLQTLTRYGVPYAMINAGGDVGASGAEHGQPWRVGIRDPRAPEKLLGVIELARGFVVSSGDYERFFVQDGRRYHHILDPRTGYPAQGPQGVTLVAMELEPANGLSLAIMVLGKEVGQRLIAQSPGLDGLIVDRDGSVWLSPGMRARLRTSP
jgi:thiamine biosynthesis lipoprotein